MKERPPGDLVQSHTLEAALRLSGTQVEELYQGALQEVQQTVQRTLGQALIVSLHREVAPALGLDAVRAPFDMPPERAARLERPQLPSAEVEEVAAALQKKRLDTERRAKTLKEKTAKKYRELDQLICACGKRGDDFRLLRKGWAADYGISQGTLTLRIQALREKQWVLQSWGGEVKNNA